MAEPKKLPDAGPPYRTSATAADAMPYGVFGTLEMGFFSYDPTTKGQGGVLCRPVGRGNDCEAGEAVVIQTSREIMALFPDGATINVKGVRHRIPPGHQRMVWVNDGRILG